MRIQTQISEPLLTKTQNKIAKMALTSKTVCYINTHFHKKQFTKQSFPPKRVTMLTKKHTSTNHIAHQPSKGIRSAILLLLMALAVQQIKAAPISAENSFEVIHGENGKVLGVRRINGHHDFIAKTQHQEVVHQNAGLHPLKIVADIKPLQAMRTDRRAGDGAALYELVVNTMIASVIKLLEQSIQVYDEPQIDMSGINKCYDANLNHINGVINGNLLVTIDYEYDERENYVAYATHCHETNERRPFTGYIMLNLA